MNWSIAFPQAKVRILPKLTSDHAPILIKLSNPKEYPKLTFRFQAAWLTHPGFRKCVHENWNSNLSLTQNNKSMAKNLMQWNKEEFGLIEKIMGQT